MRKFFAFLSMLAVAGASLAQEGEFKGYLEVTHGFVTNTFGQKVSIAGMWLPYWEKDIKATKMVDGKPIELDQPTQNRILDATVYNANAGSGYGYSEDNPSSLDDITMSGGAGAAWKHLTFGMAVEYTGQPFIIRWIGYNNYTTGRGAGVSAFDGVINDFGVRWPAESAPRQVIVTIDVSVAGMVAPSNKLYLAQQFRFNQANGEGPFIPVWTVFNASAPATVGSSEDFFF
ncbi:MAG TPA: hypothetical protein VEX38_03355, partial [Fimbriimonadaceae bacterium]|nr:hypothetical protein [Fimbriimonadaceae bacterium]